MFNRYCTKKHALHGVATRQLTLPYTESRKPPNLRLTRTRVRPILSYGLSVCDYALGRITSASWGHDSTFVSYGAYMCAEDPHNRKVNVSPSHTITYHQTIYISCIMHMRVKTGRTSCGLWTRYSSGSARGGSHRSHAWLVRSSQNR